VPAIIGGAGGVIGAERLLFGASAGRSILRTAGVEALQEAFEEGATKGSANIAAGQYVEGIDPMKGVVGSAALGGLLGGITGGGVAALSGQPLTNRQPRSLLRGSNDNLPGNESPDGQAIGAAINTGTMSQSASGMLADLNAATAEQEAAREAQINAALGGVQGEGQATTGVSPQATTGLPVPAGTAAAPVTPGAPQPTAQPTPGGQQASQVTAQQQTATLQAYGVNQAAGTPIPTWEVAGQPLYGVPTVQRFVNDLIVANSAKSQERIQLESAVVRAGLVKLTKPEAKSLVNSVTKFLDKYQLAQIETLQDAVAVIDDQIRRLGQDGKQATDKNVDSLARLYDALTGQMSPAFQQISEGVKNEQAPTRMGAVPEQASTGGTISVGGRPDDRQLQSLLSGGVPEGSPSLQDVTAGISGARSGALVAPAGGLVGDGGAVSGQIPAQGEVSGQAPTTPTAQAGQEAQAQPVPATEPAGVTPSPRPEEVSGRQAWEDMDASGVAYDSLTEKDKADWDAAVAEGRVTGEMQEQLANEYQLFAEQNFMQQILDRVMNRIIKSPNKARYFSTFVAVGADQEAILAKAQSNAARGKDGKITEDYQKYLTELRSTLAAMRGAPNAELAADYGVKLDTLKEWNQELKTFLTDKADKIQQAFKVVAVEMRLEGTDLQAMIQAMAKRSQQAQAELGIAIQPDEVVLDTTLMATEETSITTKDRTSASVQEMFNAVDTNNQSFLRITEAIERIEAGEKVNPKDLDQANTALEKANNDLTKLTEKQLGSLALDAYRADDEFFGDQIVAELKTRLETATENATKQAKKQTSKRPAKETKEKPSAVPKRETKKVPVGERARGGQEVGQRDTQKQEAAPEGKAKAQEVVLTTQETAAAAWNDLRSSMPTEIQEQIPMWNALTETQKKRVVAIGAELNMKNVEQVISLAPLAVQRVRFNAIEGEAGVDNAMNSLRQNGVAKVVAGVDQFELLPENGKDDGLYFVSDSGQVSIGFKLSTLTNGTNWSAHVVRHELGHAADMAADGGVYSSNAELQPGGVVEQELRGLYNSSKDWNQYLSYPFDKDYSDSRIDAELFAQLWSAYTDNTLRKALFGAAPQASIFMEEVIKHAQTRNFAKRGEQAAIDEATRFAVRLQRRRLQKSKVLPRQSAPAKRETFQVKPGRAPKAFMEGLSAEAINDRIDQFPQIVRGPMRTTTTGLRGWWRKGLNYIAFTQAVINRAVKSGIPSAASFGRLLEERGALASALEREVEGIADMYANVPDNERGIGDGSVNDFIFESTRQKKWGFQPSWTTTQVPIDSATKAAFDKLSPESQAFIQAVFKHGDDMLALKKATVLSYTSSEYDSLIMEAIKANDMTEAAKLRKQKVDELERFKGLFAIREGLPYAPIKRTGNYVVVAKSAEFREAEANNEVKKLKELQKDPDHYHVSFVNGEVEAQRLQEQLLSQGHFGKDAESVDYFERENEAVRNQLYGGNNFLLSVTRLRSQIDAKGDTATDTSSIAAFNQMRKIVTDMYLESLAEASARKSEIRRRGVSGEVDMLNSFTLQGRADANFISAIQYGERIQQAIAAMRKEAKLPGNRNAKSELYNELMARYTKTLEFEPMPATQKLTRLTSIWFLATSPGYYLQNLTQPYMMSLPLMAARHDVGRASGELYRAYKDLKDVIKSAKLFDQQFDFSQVPEDVRDAIQQLVVRSRIDIGLNTEMGQFTAEGHGFFTDRWNKVDKGLRLAVQKVEAINRLSTAMAAYRLEFERTNNKKAALDYADQILTDTHGDYSAWAAPRAFNTNVGKVALQFRKFQLIQLSLLAKLVNESFTGKDRAVARKALAYVLTNTAVMTGVVGMPGFAAIAWAIGALFGDDDEPYNIEMTLREYIGDETVANMILRGAPTLGGVDLSGKIGMGNMLSIMPFTQIDKLDGQKTYEIIGTLLGGPAGGLAARTADGMAYIANGDTWKGLEMMTPKGMGDLMKAIRISGEGVTNRRGDVLLGSEDIGELDTFWRGIGLAPIKQTVRSVKQSAKYELEQNFESRTSRIKSDYVKAYKSRDSQKMAEARRAWSELQEARRRNGYKTQPLSNLMKAPIEQAKRERMTKGGIQYDRGSRRYVESLEEM
jgi:hypothetical protein